MPESPTSLTSPYPSSCPSRTPSSSQSLFCSTAQPHLSLPPRCLTPYPHHIVFRSPSPTPRPFPPSSISPSPLPSSSNSAHAYISSSFPLSPSSQSISSSLNLPSLHSETTQRDGRDNRRNSRPRHTLLPPTLRMSTLHSPLGTTPGMQTKNQSPKQKGFASYLPLSPTPLLQKRLGQRWKGRNRRETKGPEAKTAHLTVQPHPQGEELGSSFPKFDDGGGNWDRGGNGGAFGLREGNDRERWGYYLEYLGCEGRRGRAYAM
ncbi:hypothetical protein I305_03254 [Cryptococcus gattii E566]|nr:hypothetical protein I305_03254 [Cryptococcus gattii E566]